jgi:hypothetical protein
VLTGYPPPVRPLEVWISAPLIAAPGSYLPSAARITVTARAWVGAGEVDRALRDAQRQVLGGDSYPPRDERTLEVVKFVARRRRERDKETWEELRKAWNETCPERWDFDNYRVFRQVYMRFVEKYAYQVYNEPNYELRERTPYEEYRDDWNDRITGRKEKRARRLTEAQEVHQSYTNPRDQRRAEAMRRRIKPAVLQEFLNIGERLRFHCFALRQKRSVVRIHYRPLKATVQQLHWAGRRDQQFA